MEYIIGGFLALIAGLIATFIGTREPKSKLDKPLFITKNADGTEDKTYLNKD